MSITLIFGSVNSGKTEELKRHINRFLVMGKDVIVILPKITESSTSFSRIPVCYTEYLIECIDNKMVLDADVIAVDNLHYFPDSISVLSLLCNKFKKTIICAGLDNNEDRVYYQNVVDLIPKSDYSYKLNGLCTYTCDGTNGIFSKRDSSGKINNVSRRAFIGHDVGSLHVITGPMYSGKTSELIRITRQYDLIHKKILAINYSKDMRYDKDSNISSHNHDKLEKTLSLESFDDLLTDLYHTIENADVIVIDEIQFFRNCFNVIKELVETHNKIVIVSGLDGDFLQNPFGDILKLAAFSDRFIRLNAVCKLSGNFADAHFTRRLVNSSETELIGGLDIYMAVSREIYNLSENDFLKLNEKQQYAEEVEEEY